jgi:hypothetical protein
MRHSRRDQRAIVRVQLEIEVDCNQPIFYYERLDSESQAYYVREALAQHFRAIDKGEDPNTFDQRKHRMAARRIISIKRTRVLTDAYDPPTASTPVASAHISTSSSDSESEATETAADGAASESSGWAFTVS